MVEIPAAVVEKIGAPYVKAMVPANTYTGQTDAVPTAAVINYLVTRADLKRRLVYQMTKAIFENLPELQAAHSAAKDIKLEDALQGMPVPVHPGAERYFKEKGVTIGQGRLRNDSAALAARLPHDSLAEHVVSVDTGGHPTAPDIDIEHGLPNGWGAGAKARVLFWIAVAFSVFQIATAVYAILPSQVLRAVHVGFLVLVSSALIANHRAHSRAALALGWALGVIGFLIGLYHWVFYAELVNRTDELNAIDAPAILSGFSGVDATTVLDFAVGVVNLVVLFVVAWRMMGPALPLICLGFLAYVLFGDYLPPPLDHRGYAVGQVVLNMAYGLEGIYGVPTYVSATYIFLFILFGTFLERAGMIQLFNDVAMGLFGSRKGGPAKVAVVLVGADGHDLGLGRRQCRHRRPVHDPADEAFRLQVGLRGRGRGDRLDGRADHAAGDGRGRVHHGREHRRALLGHRQGGDHPGRALLRLGVLDGASGGRQARSCRDGARTNCRARSPRSSANGIWRCRWSR